MSGADEPPVYRIERHAAGVLHLYRGGDLVDIDHESDGDTRDDIERWGSGVAWAEDYTGIERWDALDNVGDQWRTLVGIRFRYVTWQVEDVGVIAWDEIDSTGWVTRHIEAKPRTGATPPLRRRRRLSLPEIPEASTPCARTRWSTVWCQRLRCPTTNQR